jgi:MoxR-like ATPase
VAVEVSAASLSEQTSKIVGQLKQVIVGQDEAMRQVLTAFFAGGHCMITGVPGVAKALLIASLAKIMKLSFKRMGPARNATTQRIAAKELFSARLTTIGCFLPRCMYIM